MKLGDHVWSYLDTPGMEVQLVAAGPTIKGTRTWWVERPDGEQVHRREEDLGREELRP